MGAQVKQRTTLFELAVYAQEPSIYASSGFGAKTLRGQ